MITTQQVTDAITAIVAEAGEGFVYIAPGNKCVYVHNGEPSCIVGRTLAKLGITIETLEPFDTLCHGGAAGAHTVIASLVDAGIEFDDPDTIASALRAAQSEQDDGARWGYALETYRASL